MGDRAAARGLPGRELGGQPGRGRGVHPSPPAPERAVRRVSAPAHRSQPARLNDGGPPVDIQMPQLGETVTEGTITRWLKSVGDHVDADEPLFEVSTDKVDSEVPAPSSGTLSEILVQEGETAEVGTRLAVISDGAGATTSAPPAQAAQAAATPPPAAPPQAAATPNPAAPPHPARPPTPAPTPPPRRDAGLPAAAHPVAPPAPSRAP